MFERLFSPVVLGPATLKNRVMQLATGNNLTEGSNVGAKAVAFYEERAKGGVGSIVTQTLSVVSQPGRLSVGSRDCIPGFRTLADAIHRHGTVLIGQLNHPGRQHHLSYIPTVVGPSAIACPHSGGTPHELDVDEIADLVRAYVRGAENLREAGLDGVEIHGGQGHLIQQFLSPFSNQRDDRYGGSIEKRMTFALEILRGVREACGREFVVGFRLGAEEFTEGGLTFDQAKEIAKNLQATGTIDYLSITQSNFNTIETHTPDRRDAYAPYADFPAGIKAACPGMPVVASGRILVPERAEELLAQGKADIIGLCRPLLADAEWAAKAQQGSSQHIRRCISCNQCWGWVISHRPVGCIQNAVCGNELAWGAGTLKKASQAKRVAIVGGGPAGLEAARVAAERGHRVVLFEARERLGGEVRAAESVPGYEEVAWVGDYLSDAVAEAGVEVRLGTRATAANVLELRPDAVVIATGAEPQALDASTANGVRHVHYRDALQAGFAPGRAAVVLDDDGYYAPCAVAEALAHRGAQVHLVTRFFEAGREIPATSRITSLRAFDRLGINVVPNAWFADSEKDRVRLRHQLSGREWTLEGIDCVVHAGNRIANDALYHQLKGKVPELHRIGDAFMPRRIADAIREGHRLGREL